MVIRPHDCVLEECALRAVNRTMKYILITMLLTAVDASALEITDFKSGLMCGINKDDMGWVCFEEERIPITGQSSCVSQGQDQKCTWYGYSFDYRDAKPGQEISCTYTQSVPIRHVDPDSADDESSTTGSYTFNLDAEEGFFFNPQYSILHTSGSDEQFEINQHTVCVSEGKKVFEYQFITVYPPDPY